ncbi:putative toxin-antitoxin system toxin component, PIN family [uncultured Meiothermus sp.]|jgi:putative PIN family toxin of toxin-antitoxin system|uniref:putative toxin-antitoxin system toxin component, PIN family n=1 Tax=uncultured Meiothermus sp. TaxID=157471 RepID=UPI00262D320E|nr:putative toxin-antitoxin system toxin component, PIN family [uncultured Meiothermus sp.]
MTRPKAVLDTNIYIRALLSPTGGSSKLLNLWLQKRLTLFTSKLQIAEPKETVNVINEEGRASISEDDFAALLNLLENRGNLVPSTRQNKVSPDPDDDWMIGIAIKAGANLLVTENPKHVYQAIMPRNPPIKVLSIKDALKWLTSKAKV